MSPPSDHHPHHHPPLSWGWSQVARSRQTAITRLCRLPLAPILRPAFSKYPGSVKRVEGRDPSASFSVCSSLQPFFLLPSLPEAIHSCRLGYLITSLNFFGRVLRPCLLVHWGDSAAPRGPGDSKIERSQGRPGERCGHASEFKSRLHHLLHA